MLSVSINVRNGTDKRGFRVRERSKGGRISSKPNLDSRHENNGRHFTVWIFHWLSKIVNFNFVIYDNILKIMFENDIFRSKYKGPVIQCICSLDIDIYRYGSVLVQCNFFFIHHKLKWKFSRYEKKKLSRWWLEIAGKKIVNTTITLNIVHCQRKHLLHVVITFKILFLITLNYWKWGKYVKSSRSHCRFPLHYILNIFIYVSYIRQITL